MVRFDLDGFHDPLQATLYEAPVRVVMIGISTGALTSITIRHAS
jgi:hypothetical protein